VVPTRASRTAVVIGEHLKAEGLDVSPSKIQFWAEKGLLGQAQQTWTGGGGSEVTYPGDTLEVARIIAFLPKAARLRSDVVLACFSRGLTVSEEELRDALLVEVEALRDSLGEDVAAAKGDDVFDAASDVAAAWVARRRRPVGLRRWAHNSAGWEPGGSAATNADAMGNDERLRFLLSPVLAAVAGDSSYLESAIGGLVAGEGAGQALDLAAVESGRSRVDLESDVAKAMAIIARTPPDDRGVSGAGGDGRCSPSRPCPSSCWARGRGGRCPGGSACIAGISLPARRHELSRPGDRGQARGDLG